MHLVVVAAVVLGPMVVGVAVICWFRVAIRANPLAPAAPLDSLRSPRSGTSAAIRPGRVRLDHHRAEVLDGILFTRLRDQGQTLVEARDTVAEARRLRVGANVVLLWLDVFDAPSLTLALAADLDEEHLVSCLISGTAPRADDLTVFAALNGFDLTPPAREPQTVTTTAAVGQHDRIPMIFEPGDWTDVDRRTHATAPGSSTVTKYSLPVPDRVLCPGHRRSSRDLQLFEQQGPDQGASGRDLDSVA